MNYAMLFFVPIDRTAEAGDKTGVTQSIMRTVRRFDLSTKSGAEKSIEKIVCYLIPVPNGQLTINLGKDKLKTINYSLSIVN